MSNKMIIDASHPEETRVVVLRGNRVEEFDFESANKKPLRGNIYLAKVTRVEPSLQAAFVEYGGNRHGFLAFSEIHPDYYQIPVADRQALLEEEARSHREDDEEPASERRSRRRQRSRAPEAARAANDEQVSEPARDEAEAPGADEPFVAIEDESPQEIAAEVAAELAPAGADENVDGFASVDSDEPAEEMASRVELGEPPLREGLSADEDGPAVEIERQAARDETQAARDAAEDAAAEEEDAHEPEVTTIGDGGDSDEPVRSVRPRGGEEGEPVEVIGGDAMDETPRRVQRPRRNYKIQEVIKRRQVLLVQVVKEERGNKGAALTTYLSLAGRYSVLMPNTARGGGISRKITNTQDRSRLKAIAEELDVPEGMGVILRTAGASRTKQEVKRDFEYLLRMWETVRETTLASSAPMLVYEEGSLIKRAIRDLYSKDIDDIVVAGDAAYKEAKDFMRLLMPSNTRAVTPYRDTAPVFAKAGVEAQLDGLFSNQVTLRSGGYIVINQTEALVAIDVNSGRSTREHNIEDTAVRTNLEAADEIARQLRLRDLAGLIVVDFIDMEEARNNRSVERRMKDALKNDRARIQVGRISHFGLLEMSRQRIRTGVLEGSTVPCAHCMGSGVVRSTASVALHVLRIIEDALIRNAQFNIIVRARTAVALYILNHKRAHLRELERRFGVEVVVEADEALANGVNHALDRGEPAQGVRAEAEPAHRPGYGAIPDDDFSAEEAPEPEAAAEEPAAEEPEAAEDEEQRGETAEGEDDDNRRRRRRRRRRERGPADPAVADQPQPTDDGLAVVAEIGGDFAQAAEAAPEEGGRANGSRRRRSRRGRRDRFDAHLDETSVTSEGEAGAEALAEPALIHGDPALGGVEAAAGMDEPPASIAEALEPPTPAAVAPPQPSQVETPQAEPEEASPAPSEAAAPEPEPAPVAEPVDETPRPRRSGWWQRAKTTLVGE
ncbi:MAG TPA: Rne/Rng family ribonuclease [Roseiarcus sp.]|nr:Rne/Rng family ribonuclease [Roseiarcus sp.]